MDFFCGGVCGGVGFVDGLGEFLVRGGTCSWVRDWSCWGYCWDWDLGVLQSFFPGVLHCLFFFSGWARCLWGFGGLIVLGSWYGRCCCWMSLWCCCWCCCWWSWRVLCWRGPLGNWRKWWWFFDLVGVLSLGARTLGGSSPFSFLLWVTCVPLLLVSPSKVALVVSVVLVVSVILVELVVLVVLASLGCCNKSSAFWE